MVHLNADEWKRAAAREAAGLIRDGMLVGLGTGTTASEAIREIAKKNSKCSFIPSSSSTERLARELGLKIVELKREMSPDIVIDGADEVDPELNMIKGHGGAHTREKILAGAAKRVVIVVDRTKLVRELGERMPVPVEVIPFAHEKTMEKIERLGGKPVLRKSGGAPFVTDNGNYVVDVKFPGIKNPSELELRLNSIPGVVENGIFVGLADEVIVGYKNGCYVMRSKSDFSKFLRTAKK